MKQKLILPILILFSISLYCAEPLGKVASIQGIATMTDLKTKQKIVLRAGEPIFEGTLLKTEKNSRMIIELSGGVKKLLPESTELFFFTKETLELYKRTDQNISKYFALTGKKASNAGQISTINEKTVKKIRIDFDSGKYLEALDSLEGKIINVNQPEMLYIKAVCLLKLGVEKESEKLFQKLIDSGIYEYKKIAYYGLFIGYIRTAEIEKAKKIYALFQDESKMAEEMQKYLGE